MAYAQTIKELKKIPIDFEDHDLSVEAMQVIMSYKKEQRGAKELDFTCYVLEMDELDDFLGYLNNHSTQIPDGTRFQVVLRDKSNRAIAHWSNLDIKKDNDTFKFYCMDAANDLVSTVKTTHKIEKAFPESVVRYSGTTIQSDETNCASFAMDAAFRLAKIPDLHEQLPNFDCTGKVGTYDNYQSFLGSALEQKVRNGKTGCDLLVSQGLTDSEIKAAAKKIVYIPSDSSFPAHFGPLFRNIQSITRSEGLSNIYMGNDEISLSEYIAERTIRGTEGKPINIAVEMKRNKIKENAVQYLEKNESNFDSIMNERKNYSSLIEKKPMYEKKSDTTIDRQVTNPDEKAKERIKRITERQKSQQDNALKTISENPANILDKNVFFTFLEIPKALIPEDIKKATIHFFEQQLEDNTDLFSFLSINSQYIRSNLPEKLGSFYDPADKDRLIMQNISDFINKKDEFLTEEIKTVYFSEKPLLKMFEIAKKMGATDTVNLIQEKVVAEIDKLLSRPSAAAYFEDIMLYAFSFDVFPLVKDNKKINAIFSQKASSFSIIDRHDLNNILQLFKNANLMGILTEDLKVIGQSVAQNCIDSFKTANTNADKLQQFLALATLVNLPINEVKEGFSNWLSRKEPSEIDFTDFQKPLLLSLQKAGLTTDPDIREIIIVLSSDKEKLKKLLPDLTDTEIKTTVLDNKLAQLNRLQKEFETLYEAGTKKTNQEQNFLNRLFKRADFNFSEKDIAKIENIKKSVDKIVRDLTKEEHDSQKIQGFLQKRDANQVPNVIDFQKTRFRAAVTDDTTTRKNLDKIIPKNSSRNSM